MSSSKTLWRDEQRVTRLIELAIAEFNAGRVKNGKLGAPNYESIAAIMSVDDVRGPKIKDRFGWDPETKTVKADVERWSELLQIEEKYAKFMGRGLDHYDELCYIFGNHTASGLYRYAPAQDPATSEEEQRLYDAALGRSARSDLPRAASPFTPGEGFKWEAEASISHAFGCRIAAERIANSNLSRSSLVNECVDALMAIQPPIGQEAMGRAMDKIIQSATFRQAFLRLSEDARRAYVLYLK
ncbi:hypothetical protein CJ030_MR1G014135 [Morella rubra]|uniref:Myb/SANT-like domain-containing protein n=1 Tax=Morella rubra TaxID=262757 RepID=A0A6A1WRM6_9ROSI|nr:hypothetical protein CJ030_MR1G014135 [Morella rubra]